MKMENEDNTTTGPHNLHHLSNTVKLFKCRRLRTERVARMKILRGKATKRKTLGRLRRRWEDNLEYILKEYVSLRGI